MNDPLEIQIRKTEKWGTALLSPWNPFEFIFRAISTSQKKRSINRQIWDPNFKTREGKRNHSAPLLTRKGRTRENSNDFGTNSWKTFQGAGEN